MPRSAPDRTLRRLVSDLAMLQNEDREAILAGLDAGKRRTVEAMLKTYLAPFDSVTAAPSQTQPDVDPSRFSPLLVQRLRPAADIAMTEATREALRDAAAKLRPRAIPDRPRERSGFLARLMGGAP